MAPQGEESVAVLLHAFQVDWALATGFRDAAPVTIATGKAENEIIPDQPRRIELPKTLAAASTESQPTAAGAGEPSPAIERREDIAAFIEDPRSLAAVMAFLGRVGEQRETVEALNSLLREAGQPVRLRTRRDAERS
jgi:hypothetical protein